MAISPSCRSTTIRRAMSRPRPVPLPTSLVVKNGSNARARTSAGRPGPVSPISTSIAPPPSPTRVATRRVPSPPIASAALSITFVQTWFNSPGNPSISGRSSAYARSTAIPRNLWPSITRVLSSPSAIRTRCRDARSSCEYERTAATSSDTRPVDSRTSVSRLPTAAVLAAQRSPGSRSSPGNTSATRSAQRRSAPARASVAASSQGRVTPRRASQAWSACSRSDRSSGSR